MANRKYTKDYRLENVTGKDGKVRTKPVYRGELYQLPGSSEEKKKHGRKLTVLELLVWIFFVLALLLNTQAARTMYIIMPFAFALFAQLYTTSGAVLYLENVRREQKRKASAEDTVMENALPADCITREDSEKISQRLAAGPFLLLVLVGASLIGNLVLWVRHFSDLRIPEDPCFLALQVLILAGSALLFSERKLGDAKKK